MDDDCPRLPCTCTIDGSNTPCPQHGMFNRIPMSEWKYGESRGVSRAVVDRRTTRERLNDACMGYESGSVDEQDLLRMVAKEVPQPRAFVAMSPDRQWYTVLDKEAHASGKRYFTIFAWSDFMGAYQWRDLIEDTGQGAEAALSEFLEKKNA